MAYGPIHRGDISPLLTLMPVMMQGCEMMPASEAVAWLYLNVPSRKLPMTIMLPNTATTLSIRTSMKPLMNLSLHMIVRPSHKLLQIPTHC